MRHCGFGLALWLMVGPGVAHAQQVPVTSTDTLRAVHRLFQARRTGGVVFGLLGGSYTGIGVTVAVQGKQPTGTYGPDVTSEMGLGAGVPLLALGLTKLLRFSTWREQRVVAEYNTGRALPRSIRARLKPRHFRQHERAAAPAL